MATTPAVPPPPGRLACWLFHRYVERLTARHFAAVHWGGAVPARERPPATTLFIANHTNWWDGFLGWLVSRRLGLHFHILMEAGGLDRYWMFKQIGALPLHRDSAAGAYADLDVATGHLRRPATSLWIFPQGSRRPASEPVTDTERGAAHLALALAGACTVVPVAFRYAYLGEQLPEAFIWQGDAFEVGRPSISEHRSARRRALTQHMESRLQQAVGALDEQLRQENLAAFSTLVAGRLSINKRLDRVRHAAGTIDGPFEQRNG